MILCFNNVGTETLVIEQNGQREMLPPATKKAVYFVGKAVCVRIMHTVSDRFRVGWYLAESALALSQMRTVLVVDGEYVFKPMHDNTMVEVKSWEYVFEKHTAYQTFAFSANDCTIERKRLEVVQGDKVYRKAKFLYLFGGIKSLLIPTGVVSFILLINAFSDGSVWNWTRAGFWVICFTILLRGYKRSLTFLKNSMQETQIIAYIDSIVND